VAGHSTSTGASRTRTSTSPCFAPTTRVLREQLADWDLWIAHGGTLRPWTSGTRGPPENAVWARPTPGDEWHIDFKIEAVEGGDWVYRRDPAVRRPVAGIGVAVDGIPYLAPDLAGLYVRGS
jgi:hypothetical protein